MQQVDKTSGKNRTVLLKRHGQPHGLQVPYWGVPNSSVSALLISHPAQHCCLLSEEAVGAVPPSQWCLGSSLCGQVSLVLLEHLSRHPAPSLAECGPWEHGMVSAQLRLSLLSYR